MTREEAIERLVFLKGVYSVDTEMALDMAIEALSAEAVQGEWVKTSDGNGWNEWYVLKCPICGATIEDKHYHSWKYNFCPNCGAKMKDGDNNEID